MTTNANESAVPRLLGCDQCHSNSARVTIVLLDIDTADGSPQPIHVCTQCAHCRACKRALGNGDRCADFRQRTAVADRGIFHEHCTTKCSACAELYPCFRMHTHRRCGSDRLLRFCYNCDPTCPRCGESIEITQTVCDVFDAQNGMHCVYHELCLPANMV